MTLLGGTRIGAYEVVSLIASGGMGEVYRATDTTLGRQVALKILPDAFAADTDRLARFEREAKTLALLNHPHIAAISGFEKSAGAHALVMKPESTLASPPTFQTRFRNNAFPYAVTADGQRFLVNRSEEAATTPPIMLVVNWPATLAK